MNEGAFFQDLALLMTAAGLTALLFSRLNWPKVLGYIFAGVLLSEHTWGVRFLVDQSSVRIIGQLGIVFLMLTMGLEFSTSEMKKIRAAAMPAAIVDTVVMTYLGFTVARTVFGWPFIPSLFLGVAMCDSSTTLLAKIIDEMGWRERPFVKYVLGTSVFEDIICVGLIALVTGVAGGRGLSLGSAGMSLGGLLVFFVAVLATGFIFLPRLLTSVARHGDNETLLLTLLGTLFFVCYLAFRLDYSLALGAFLVGILGSGSEVRARLKALIAPLKAMFAAVFFVSVGLLVDPFACFHHLPEILVLSALVIVGKAFNCTLGALIGGVRLKTAVETGLSLAQIGEFAFMVALLYVGLTDDAESPMYPIVIGVSLITSVINPFLLRLTDRAGDWAERAMPAKLMEKLDAYRALRNRYREADQSGNGRREVRKDFAELVVIAILEFGAACGLGLFESREWGHVSLFLESHKHLFCCLAMNAIILLMSVAVVAVTRRLAGALSETFVGKGEERWQLACLHISRAVVYIAVFTLFFLEMLMINAHFAPETTLERILLVAVMAAAAGFGWKYLARAARRAGVNFSEAMKTDERLAALGKEVVFKLHESELATIEVPFESPAVGRTIGELNVRAKTGAVIISVKRGGREIRHVGAEFAFEAFDEITMIGDRAKVTALKKLLETGS